MKSQPIKVHFDNETNTLYAKRHFGRAAKSRELGKDSDIVLTYNKKEEIIGTIIFNSSKITYESWVKNRIRDYFPPDIREVLDDWFKKKASIGQLGFNLCR
jgi:uncharacterized protein YuzE